MESALKHFFHILCLAILLSIGSAYGAEPAAKVIKLRYQTAETILPLLRDAMGDDARIVGHGDSLIVRGDVRALQQIRRLLRQLDKVPRALKITVKRAENIKQTRQIEVYRTQQRQEEANVQSVTVLSGHIAFVRLSHTRPVVESAYAGEFGSGAEMTTEERSTGIYVQPRLIGKEVILKIASEKESLLRFGLNELRGSSLVTTVTVKLGQWTKLGSSSHQEQGHKRGRVYQTEDQESQNTVFVRIDKR